MKEKWEGEWREGGAEGGGREGEVLVNKGKNPSIYYALGCR